MTSKYRDKFNLTALYSAIKFRKPMFLGIIVASIALCGTTTLAQDEVSITRLLNCQKITSSDERLACFDSQTSEIRREIDQGELVPVYEQDVRTARRGMFGIDNVRLPNFLNTDRDDIREIDTTIVRAQRGANNRWRFELEDGSVWDQIDSEDPHFNSRPGTAVRVRKASMGSYLLTIGRATPLRVSRRS